MMTDEEVAESPTFHVYRYRWVILSIFCFYTAVNFFQFLQYTIISNIVVKFYDVDGTLVDLSGLAFMICFVIFCGPVNYLIEKYDLRIISILSSGLTLLGNGIKLISVERDRFFVVLIGQFICAVAQVFMMSIPSKLASTWFGSEEVSTACAIAILGTQIGVAAGSIFPSNFVKNSNDMKNIRNDLMTFGIINTSLSAAAFLLVLLLFRVRPPTPPSMSEEKKIDLEKPSVLNILKTMIHNKNYILIILAFSGCNGLYTAFGVMINPTYLHYFPEQEVAVGTVTAVAIIAGGCLGSVFFGYLLDKWHHFKIISFVIIFGSAVSYVFTVVAFELNSQISTYFTIPLFGFFIGSTLLVGFEFATEVMYPLPEAYACAVVNSFIYIFGIVYTLALGQLFDALGYNASTHSIIVVLILICSIMVYFIKPRLKRHEANLLSSKNSLSQ